MNLLESPKSTVNHLMMGPDGVAYDPRTGMVAAFQPPNDLYGTTESPRSTEVTRGAIYDSGSGSGCFTYSADLAGSDSGVGSGCFAYSADAGRGDSGQGSGCFTY